MTARGAYPSERLDQYIVRFPDGLRDRVKAAAKVNGRSMNAEIIARIEALPTAAPLTAAQLSDALGCFWNAAIGQAHNRQSAAAMDAASVMAEGFAAVADRLAGAPPVPPETMLQALVAAERFIRGFEGDELQEGMDELLATVRAAIGGAA